MIKLAFLAAALLAALPVPAVAAGAGSFVLVNQSGKDMGALSIRRFGTQAWQPLQLTPVAGARGPVNFTDPDCAFDIRATLAGGGQAVWQGVNLCEAKVVVLHRDPASGATWAEYE